MLTKEQIKEAEEIAFERQKKYTKGGGHTFGAHDNVERTGMLGEFEFSEITGLPVDKRTLKNGDNGIDFWAGPHSIDMKTAEFPKYLIHKRYHVLRGNYAEIFVLGRWTRDDQVEPLKWCYSSGIEGWPTRSFDPKGIDVVSHYKPRDEMEPLETLWALIEPYCPKLLAKKKKPYQEGMARIRGVPARFDFRDDVDICWSCKGLSRAGCPICFGSGLLAWA